MDDGMTIAASFFALGLLWLFITELALLFVVTVKRLIG